MFQAFLEIAFEAELDTSEHPELLEMARDTCNEDPCTRQQAIAELREMIYERNECRPHRTDDAYLLRFLRARKFVVRSAHRLLVRNCTFKEKYPSLYNGVDLWGMKKVGGAYEGTLLDRPDVGRLSILRFGTWDPSEFPVEDLVKAGLAITEIGLRSPKMQILGGTIIVDLENITLRHVATLTPTVAYQIVALMGAANPTTAKALHIINYSWILNTFFYLFKQFIHRDAMRKIFFHGYDLKSLQKHIDLECLPERYGGTCRSLVPASLWFDKIKKYRDERFDREMKQLGYIIKE